MWEAVGPACDAFKEICPEINKLLETRSEELDKGEDISPAFSYGIWMMGRDPAPHHHPRLREPACPDAG